MQRGRKLTLSQKSLAFLRAQMVPPQLASHPPRSALGTLLERIRSALVFVSMIGFVLLILSAPIVLVLFFVTPWNLTVLWLTIAAILGGGVFLGLLPKMAASSPWKAAGLGVVALLFGLAFYLLRTAALPMTLIYTPLLLGYAILYAWQGAIWLQAYQQQRRNLLACMLASILAIACCAVAGWSILQSLTGQWPDQTLIPVILLIGPHALFIQIERNITRAQ